MKRAEPVCRIGSAAGKAEPVRTKRPGSEKNRPLCAPDSRSGGSAAIRRKGEGRPRPAADADRSRPQFGPLARLAVCRTTRVQGPSRSCRSREGLPEWLHLESSTRIMSGSTAPGSYPPSRPCSTSSASMRFMGTTSWSGSAGEASASTWCM